MSFSIALFALILTLPMLVAGVYMALRARRGTRVGTQPHCARCEYLLVGISSQRCPECGVELTPENMVYGERTRRPDLVWVGLALASVALVAIVPTGIALYRGVNWYHFKPTYFVMQDVRSPSVSLSSRAMRELTRRHKDGALSPGTRKELTALALQVQGSTATSVNDTDMVEFLARELRAGRLSDADRKLFLEQCVQTSLTVPPTVAAGERIAWQTSERARSPSGFWVQLTDRTLSIDGVPQPQGSGMTTLSGVGAGGSSSGTLPCPEPGEHLLQVGRAVHVYDGPFGDFGASTQLLDVARTLDAKFEVVSDTPPTAPGPTTGPAP